MASATAIETTIPEEELEIEQPELEGDDPAQAALEARARDLGWHPFAEYRGLPGKWVDAKTFIQRGEEILPIVRANNHRLEEQLKRQGKVIEDLNRSNQEQGVVLREMREMARKADERGYQRALADAKAERDAAVVAGDTVAFQQADEKVDALQDTRAKITEPPPVPVVEKPQIDPAVLAFVDDNPWFNTDNFLNQQMVAQHLKVIRKHPKMPLADQLDMAKDNLVAEYPEMFDGEEVAPPAPRPRQRAATVQAPTNQRTEPRRGAVGIDSIADPAERAQAREAFNRSKRQMSDYTEAEFMAIYEDPHGDAIEIARTMKEKTRVRA